MISTDFSLSCWFFLLLVKICCYASLVIFFFIYYHFWLHNLYLFFKWLLYIFWYFLILLDNLFIAPFISSDMVFFRTLKMLNIPYLKSLSCKPNVWASSACFYWLLYFSLYGACFFVSLQDLQFLLLLLKFSHFK